ncbi:hypothetical protein ACIQ9M_31770 [Streptomyces californicus]|uniref:hypothetical protein n=1 Tax=Streptomyces TaxID=1883 RepID=UPI003430F95C
MNQAEVQEVKETVLELLELLHQVDRRDRNLDALRAMAELEREWRAPLPGSREF